MRSDPRAPLYNLEKQQTNMLKFDNYFLRGLLTVNIKGEKKPLYIAEYKTGGQPPHSIAIYDVQTDVQPDGKKYYDKKYKMVSKTIKKYDDSTLLGKLAKGNTKDEVVKVKEYELPLFVTTIVSGTDTFTGHRGDGFWEHARGHFDTATGSYEQGERTGVFLCLDSFKWADANYHFDDVRSALNDQYSQY